MKSGIYRIINKLNSHVYIGSSICISNRLWSHKTCLRKGNHHCWRLQEDWNKFGEAAFIFEPLFTCSIDDLKSAEQNAMDTCKDPLYNSSLCAETPMRDLEVAARVGDSVARAWADPVKRARLLAGLRAAAARPESKLAKSISLKKSHNTPETKAKLSKVRSMPVRCIETGIEFSSAREAAKWCIAQGLTGSKTAASYINKVVKGQWESCWGLHWEKGSKNI